MSIRRSLGIVTLTRLIVFGLSLGTVIIVSRLLTPAEIGLFSVSVAAVSLGHVFRDFGVGQYLIQVREVTRERRRAAFTVTLSFSLLIAVCLFLGRHLAADFYRNTAIADVLTLLALNFLVLPFGAPLRTLLQREMQFGKLAIVNIVNHVVQSGTTILTALAGESYLSMAWGSIAGNIANVAVLIAISPTRALDWPTTRGLNEVLHFGSKSSVAAVTTEAGLAAPDLVLGRTLGFADVAIYSRASGLVTMATRELMYVVRSVYAPSFAKKIRRGGDPATAYATTMSLLLGLTLPMLGFLAVASPYVINLMFGDQWTRSWPLASMLCIYSMLSAPLALAPTSLAASGKVGPMVRCRLLIELSRLIVMMSSIFLPLESVVLLLGPVFAVDATAHTIALRRHIGLLPSMLWRSVRSSFLLLPFVVLGPLSIAVAATYLIASSDLLVIFGSAVLAIGGWLIGLRVVGHPLQDELRHAIRRVRGFRGGRN